MDFKYYVCAETCYGVSTAVKGFNDLEDAKEFFNELVGKYYLVYIRTESLKCKPISVKN